MARIDNAELNPDSAVPGQADPTTASVWRVVEPALLRVRQWEEACVVYDGGSGTTHLLTPTAAAALAWLVSSGHAPSSQTLPEAVLAEVTELARMGLVAAGIDRP